MSFTLTRPKGRRIPVLVEVPHAGLSVPDDVREELCVVPDEVLRDSDIWVDRLYADAPDVGATLLTAHVARHVVDLNRGPEDVDRQTVPDHPNPQGTHSRGVVWRTTTDGRQLLRAEMTYAQFKRRIDRYHRPYHERLRDTLNELRSEFGFAILIAGHSMPSVGRVVRGGPMVARADVVPGTRGRTTAAGVVIDAIDAHFRAAGLSLAHDSPYKGGYSTQAYGQPAEGLHAVQIELSRGLYVDEANGRPLEGAFGRLRDQLTSMVARVGAVAP